MASSVPNLSFDNFTIDIQGPGGELNTNGGFGLEIELVLSESGEQIGLADAGVPNENHLEQVVVIIIGSVASHCCSDLGSKLYKEETAEGRERESYCE